MSARSRKVACFEKYVVVQGAGAFPLDMLRYDCCFPLAEADSHAMGRDDPMLPRRVALKCRAVSDLGPTERRWASYGWTVLFVTQDTDELAEFERRVALHKQEKGRS